MKAISLPYKFVNVSTNLFFQMNITILPSFIDYLIGIANIWRHGIVTITMFRLPWKEPEIK